MCFAAAEMMVPIDKVISILLGRVPFDEDVLFLATEEIDSHVEELEAKLVDNTFLVDQTISVADLFIATCFYRCFTLIFDIKWRNDHPTFMNWFDTVSKHPIVVDFFNTIPFIDKRVETPIAKKKSTMNISQYLKNPPLPLDEWKKVYSNSKTKEEALTYFWNTFYDDENWSLWRVDYKYNDELTQCFMSKNLIGGFSNRLLASINNMFGCFVIYGENNNNGIIGAFLVRGQDAISAFSVAPEWDSYSYTKLDASKPKDRSFVENLWNCDKHVTVNGEIKQIVDVEVFK